MSSYWDNPYGTTSSSTSTNPSYSYGYRYKRSHCVYRHTSENPERPLAYLKKKEKELREEPLDPIPVKPALFDPKELVLGGETGWKKFQPKKQ